MTDENRYAVTWYWDSFKPVATFAEALAKVRELSRPYHGWGVVAIVNLDGLDDESTGLTEDETEAFDALIDELTARDKK